MEKSNPVDDLFMPRRLEIDRRAIQAEQSGLAIEASAEVIVGPILKTVGYVANKGYQRTVPGPHLTTYHPFPEA